MFDEFRQQAGTGYEDEETEAPAPESGRKSYFLGMTPIQRFILAVMMLIMTCILGIFCLLITESIAVPFI